jgi:hypothetical protein
LKYAIEQDGGPTIVVLENGDQIMIRTVLGNITPNGNKPDGTPDYNLQFQVAMFVTPRAKVDAR